MTDSIFNEHAPSMIGAKFRDKKSGKIVTVVGEYGEHRDESAGYEYRVQGESGQGWISTAGAHVRWEKIADGA